MDGLEVIFGFLCFQNVPNFPEELTNKIARIGRMKEKNYYDLGGAVM